MSSYYESDDRSSFLPKKNSLYADPLADVPVIVPPPEHTAVRPQEQLSMVNDNCAEDEMRSQPTLSAFVHKNDSICVFDSQSQEGQTNNESSIDEIWGLKGEPTVKQVGLDEVVTVPETTTIHEACRRMASESVDALFIMDSNRFVIGILDSEVQALLRFPPPPKLRFLLLRNRGFVLPATKYTKDIVTRVIASDLDLVNTAVSKVMTRNPKFVYSDTLASDALLKMYNENIRQLLVIEKDVIIGLATQLTYTAAVLTGFVAKKGENTTDAAIKREHDESEPKMTSLQLNQ